MIGLPRSKIGKIHCGCTPQFAMDCDFMQSGHHTLISTLWNGLSSSEGHFSQGVGTQSAEFIKDDRHLGTL